MQAQQAVAEYGDAVWRLAAVALVLSGREDEAGRAAAEVVRLLGVDVPDGGGEGFAGQAAAPLLETAALVTGGRTWDAQPDEALVAHGQQSGRAAEVFAPLLPSMPGLAEALDRPGARMLDVGTGIGALAAGWLARHPHLHAVGIDVLPRVLRLAREQEHGPRLELRLQDVATLEEESAYDLAWVPARFVPEDALRQGLPRVARALRPGGWVTLGHDVLDGDPLSTALARLRLAAFGGTLLDDEGAAELLREAGLVDVRRLPTPPRVPAVSAGRAPQQT